MAPARKLPRAFDMPWGRGKIIEEASFEGEYHEPTLQLLQYNEGPGTGSFSVRFCTYGHNGRFQRSPLMVNQEDIEGLREALKQAPRLQDLLRRLIA